MVAPSPAGSGTLAASSAANYRTDTPPKTLRGLNKPKCIQCGNVARSRCPYQSCKSCCSKAENPCHIHVLKANATFPEKTSGTNSPVFSQQTTDPSPSVSSHRAPSLRQLSSNFAQFNNVLLPIRKKPLTKKDAASINEWRFKKLREFRDRSIEVENEAFDRYMKNVCFLEEVFSLESLTEVSEEVEPLKSDPNSPYTDEKNAMILEMKLKLRANPIRKENFRKRIHNIVDQGLKKLQMCVANDGAVGVTDQTELDKSPRLKGWQAERASLISDLNEKLNKARNEEDLQSCLELKAQLGGQHEVSTETGPKDHVSSVPAERGAENDQKSRQVAVISPLKLVTSTAIDDETLNRVNAYFSSLKKVECL